MALLERGKDFGCIGTCCCCWEHVPRGRQVAVLHWLTLPSPLNVLHSQVPGTGEGASATRPSHWLLSPQTTYKGKSSFQTYSDYLRWEGFLQQQLQTFPEGSALRHGFQTCEHWKQIFMEIIGEQRPALPSPPLPPPWLPWDGWRQPGTQR